MIALTTADPRPCRGRGHEGHHGRVLASDVLRRWDDEWFCRIAVMESTGASLAVHPCACMVCDEKLAKVASNDDVIMMSQKERRDNWSWHVAWWSRFGALSASHGGLAMAYMHTERHMCLLYIRLLIL